MPKKKQQPTVEDTIKALSQFPTGAAVYATAGFINVELAGRKGDIVLQPSKPAQARTCDFEGWMDDVFPTPGDRINRWLVEHPKEAREIAFAAIAGLYLEEDEESILPEHDSYPRGDGSEYVDEVGRALQLAGISPLIDELQAAWVDPDEEDAVRLSFRPQASVRKNIIDVDPEGESTWSVPRAAFLAQFPDEETWNEEHELRDQMKDHPSAPRWVRNWSGPFEVELAEDEDPWKEEKP